MTQPTTPAQSKAPATPPAAAPDPLKVRQTAIVQTLLDEATTRRARALEARDTLQAELDLHNAAVDQHGNDVAALTALLNRL